MPDPYTMRDWRSEKAVRSLFDRMGFSAEQSHRAVEGFRSELARTCAAPRTPRPTLHIQIQERGRVDEAFKDLLTSDPPYEFQRYYAEDSEWAYFKGVPMDEAPERPKVRLEMDIAGAIDSLERFREAAQDVIDRPARGEAYWLGAPA